MKVNYVTIVEMRAAENCRPFYQFKDVDGHVYAEVSKDKVFKTMNLIAGFFNNIKDEACLFEVVGLPL